jgi:hypothetical protein
MKQRDVLWRKARCGVVTASRFSDVITQPRTKEARYNGEWSETAKSYMLEKLAELLTGIPADRFQSAPTKWGTEYEAEAFGLALPVIAERFGCEVQRPEGQFAFLQHPTEEMIGCSPDGAIGDDGLLEIKCGYSPTTHLRTIMSGTMPDKHCEQTQGSLWVSGRQFYIFASYDPRMNGTGVDPLFVCKVERDDAYIDNELAPKVLAFRDWLLSEYERLTGGKAPF